MATGGNRAMTARTFKVPRLPGDIMIYPMIVGLLINTFCPQVLEIGGVVVLIPKLLLAAVMGLAVAWFFNDDLLGLSSVSIIGGISFCNISARGQRPVGWRTPRRPSRCTRRATWF